MGDHHGQWVELLYLLSWLIVFLFVYACMHLYCFRIANNWVIRVANDIGTLVWECRFPNLMPVNVIRLWGPSVAETKYGDVKTFYHQVPDCVLIRELNPTRCMNPNIYLRVKHSMLNGGCLAKFWWCTHDFSIHCSNYSKSNKLSGIWKAFSKLYHMKKILYIKNCLIFLFTKGW